jgi:hypothetical protein
MELGHPLVGLPTAVVDASLSAAAPLPVAPEAVAILLAPSFFLGLAFEDFNAQRGVDRPGGVRTFPVLALAGLALYLIEPMRARLEGDDLSSTGHHGRAHRRAARLRSARAAPRRAEEGGIVKATQQP